MTDGVSLQSSTLASPTAGTKIATKDLGLSGHAQIFQLRKGTPAFTDPSCDTTADLLLAANTDRVCALIQNAGAVDCYIGPSGVTTSSGLLLKAEGGVWVDDLTTIAWYGITASGTADVRVCEVS